MKRKWARVFFMEKELPNHDEDKRFPDWKNPPPPKQEETLISGDCKAPMKRKIIVMRIESY
jgi:hypothetical protein